MVNFYMYVILCVIYVCMQKNKTPLHWASCNGHGDVVEILIKYKANVNDQDKVSNAVCMS